MYNTQNVRDILDAIDSVKLRARKAWRDHDNVQAQELVGDLFALECCLTYEVRRLLDAEDAYEKECA
jgi:quinol monooxygenase YgiN